MCSSLLVRLGIRNTSRQHWQLVDREYPEPSPFPGFHEQHPGPVPESQAAITSVAHLFSLSPPPVPNMSFLVLGLSSTLENMWQFFGKFSETRSKHSRGLSRGCQVSPSVAYGLNGSRQAFLALAPWLLRSAREVRVTSPTVTPHNHPASFLKGHLDPITPLRGLSREQEDCTGFSLHWG